MCKARCFRYAAESPLRFVAPVACVWPQLKEVQNTLELVQGQRNDLRQEVKDLKAALADAHSALEVRGVLAAAAQATACMCVGFSTCRTCRHGRCPFSNQTCMHPSRCQQQQSKDSAHKSHVYCALRGVCLGCLVGRAQSSTEDKENALLAAREEAAQQLAAAKEAATAAAAQLEEAQAAAKAEATQLSTEKEELDKRLKVAQVCVG